MPNPRVTPNKKAKTDELITKFRKLGFSQVEHPEAKMPQMPDDKTIHSQSIPELSKLMARYTAWREYAEDQLIVVTARCNVLEEEVSWLRKKAFVMAKGTVTERKALAEADEKVMAKNSEYTMALAERDMIAGKVESFTNCLTTLSREVTLRMGNPNTR